MTVTALDDHTVQFHLPAPFAPFLRSMGTAIYPKHILEPYVAAGTFGQVWDIDTDPKEVIGTGPFTISSYVPSERVVLSRIRTTDSKTTRATACRTWTKWFGSSSRTWGRN